MRKPLGLCNDIETSSTFGTNVPLGDSLSNIEKDDIEENADFPYAYCWKGDILQLRALVAEKSWIEFDLEDTLHEFHCSSGRFTDRVFAAIFNQH